LPDNEDAVALAGAIRNAASQWINANRERLRLGGDDYDYEKWKPLGDDLLNKVMELTEAHPARENRLIVYFVCAHLVQTFCFDLFGDDARDLCLNAFNSTVPRWGEVLIGADFAPVTAVETRSHCAEGGGQPTRENTLPEMPIVYPFSPAGATQTGCR
jgi:hypothetical protein